MTTVPNVTIWQSRYSKLNFSQVIINYERDTARLMLSDFKDQSLFTQQIGSQADPEPEPSQSSHWSILPIAASDWLIEARTTCLEFPNIL